MPVIVYFENACNPNGEKDEYGLVMEGGGSYAEIWAYFETDEEYMKNFPSLAKEALDNGFSMITESEVEDDDERVTEAKEYLNKRKKATNHEPKAV